MPAWDRVAALRQALRGQRGRVAAAGEILWRRKLVVVACVGVVLALTAAYASTLAPAYQAEALVALPERPGEGAGPAMAGEDQLDPIESRAMAERLVERLDLHFLPEFRREGAARGSRLADLLPHALLERLPPAWVGSLRPAPVEGEATDEQRAARLWEAAVAAAMARIRAEPRPPSAVALRFTSEDPQLAAAGANGLAELYLEQRPKSPQNVPPSDRATVQQDIERLRGSIRETAQAIAAARAGADALTGAAGEQRRLDLTGELAFWRRERAELEARLRQGQAVRESGAGLEDAALVAESERLDALQAGAGELRQQLAALSQQYGEQDPQVVEMRAQLAALERERQGELEQVLEQLRDELAIIQSRETALAAEIAALGEPGAAAGAADDVVVLEQKLAADRALLRERLEQAAGRLASGAAGIAPPDARLVAPAVAPERPTYPRLALIWGAALAGALLLEMLLACALEALQRARA
jgi:uncharacterized protein involved in exopolysaccharide biosynthesis